MDPLTERVRSHFDELGEGEWHRLDDSPRGRVAFEVHRRMLAERIRPGDRVLEVGAGPGRFTIALAELGARVTVTDISPVQLELNEQKVRESGLADAVESRTELDARDLSQFGKREIVHVIQLAQDACCYQSLAFLKQYLLVHNKPAHDAVLRVFAVADEVPDQVDHTLGFHRFLGAHHW